MSISRRTFLTASAGGAAASAMFGRAAFANPLISADQLMTLMIPHQAPDLAFTNSHGNASSVSKHRGTGLVVNLWAPWCMPCLDELPTLDSAYTPLGRDGIKVLPICLTADSPIQVYEFLQALYITHLPVLLNQDQSDLKLFGKDGIPASMIINTRGEVTATTKGSADWSTPAAISAIRRLTA